MRRREFIAAQDRSSSMLHRKWCRRYDGHAIADDAVDMVAFRPIKRVSLSLRASGPVQQRKVFLPTRADY